MLQGLEEGFAQLRTESADRVRRLLPDGGYCETRGHPNAQGLRAWVSLDSSDDSRSTRGKIESDLQVLGSRVTRVLFR